MQLSTVRSHVLKDSVSGHENMDEYTKYINEWEISFLDLKLV